MTREVPTPEEKTKRWEAQRLSQLPPVGRQVQWNWKFWAFGHIRTKGRWRTWYHFYCFGPVSFVWLVNDGSVHNDA